MVTMMFWYGSGPAGPDVGQAGAGEVAVPDRPAALQLMKSFRSDAV
jgi:hypothetical protein